MAHRRSPGLRLADVDAQGGDKETSLIMLSGSGPGQEVGTPAGHADEVLSVAVFTDGEYVITRYDDRTAAIWVLSSV